MFSTIRFMVRTRERTQIGLFRQLLVIGLEFASSITNSMVFGIGFVTAFLIAPEIAPASSGAGSVNACRAHDPQSDGVPYCPPGAGNGPRMIADNYFPAMAVSLNDQFGRDFAVAYAMKVLEAQPDRPPQLLIHSRPMSGTIRTLRAEIAQRAPDAATRERWLAAITEVGGLGWSWPQDTFQSFIDPATGRPVIRETPLNSDRHSFMERGLRNVVDTSVQGISRAAQEACGIATGRPLPHPAGRNETRMPWNELKGGNIEATANGICLIGQGTMPQGQWHAMAASVCGDSRRAINVPTFVLESGHADEIVATIRAPNRRAPCDQVIMVASPDAAIAALERDRSAPFMQFNGRTQRQNQATYQSDEMRYQELCREVFTYQASLPVEQRPVRGGRSVRWLRVSIPNAVASSPSIRRSVSECAELTNGEVVDYLKSPASRLGQVNRSIQQHMTVFKRQLAERLLATQTTCTPPAIIDVPNLFTGRMLDRETNPQTDTVVSTVSRSINPNPTNGTQFGSTYIAPDAGNAALRADLEQKLSALGVKVETLDTTALHANVGNIHCATNVMRYCRPGTPPPESPPVSQAPQRATSPAPPPSVSRQRPSGGRTERQAPATPRVPAPAVPPRRR